MDKQHDRNAPIVPMIVVEMNQLVCRRLIAILPQLGKHEANPGPSALRLGSKNDRCAAKLEIEPLLLNAVLALFDRQQKGRRLP